MTKLIKPIVSFCLDSFSIFILEWSENLLTLYTTNMSLPTSLIIMENRDLYYESFISRKCDFFWHILTEYDSFYFFSGSILVANFKMVLITLSISLSLKSLKYVFWVIPLLKIFF